MRYRRSHVPGGTYFFTVVTHARRPWLYDPLAVRQLGQAFRQVKQERPFRTVGMVVMPDHFHTLWQLPPDDADYSTRWMRIKQVMNLLRDERLPLWQPRFWEHTVQDENDLEQHLNYIHFNPVKHGWVQRARDWPHSSFHRYVKAGVYSADWGQGMDLPSTVRE